MFDTGLVRKGKLAEKIDEANREVVSRFANADPWFERVVPAKEAVPGLEDGVILHAGPAIAWEDMCETERQGGVNGALFEGYAKDEAEARRLFETGSLRFEAGNDHHVICSGTGITTPSMCLIEVTDRNTGKKGWCAPFEWKNRGGLGGWGVFNEDIRAHLIRMREFIAPAFNRALAAGAGGGLSMKPIFASGISMGDELHSRQEAVGLYGTLALLKLFDKAGLSAEERQVLTGFLTETVRFFHPVGMASAMSLLSGVRGVPYSTVLTGFAGNGVTFGVKLAGTGETWFTAPSPIISGEVKDTSDVLPWIGDSCAMECAGFGGFAAAASPVVLLTLGKTLADGIRQTAEMGRITLLENESYPIPAMNWAGAPQAVDLRLVLETGVTPVMHGGMMSRSGKRLGGGTAHVPMECFEKAFEEFVRVYGTEKER